MNTLMNEIFEENTLIISGDDSYGQQNNRDNLQEMEFIGNVAKKHGLSAEQEFEFWDKLKRKARDIAAAIMISRDALRQRKLEDYRRQNIAITQDINKDKAAGKPQNEMSVTQEIFMEAEEGDKKFLFKNYDTREYNIDEKDFNNKSGGKKKNNQNKSNRPVGKARVEDDFEGSDLVAHSNRRAQPKNIRTTDEQNQGIGSPDAPKLRPFFMSNIKLLLKNLKLKEPRDLNDLWDRYTLYARQHNETIFHMHMKPSVVLQSMTNFLKAEYK